MNCTPNISHREQSSFITHYVNLLHCNLFKFNCVMFINNKLKGENFIFWSKCWLSSNRLWLLPDGKNHRFSMIERNNAYCTILSNDLLTIIIYRFRKASDSYILFRFSFRPVYMTNYKNTKTTLLFRSIWQYKSPMSRCIWAF